MTSYRIDHGGLIDRTRPLVFTFDGRSYTGFDGDTLASALLANGVRIMGRSFKYHRPRGPWSAWVDDPNAIMNVKLNGREFPNCAATTTYLEDGMAARSVNAFPSAQFDVKGGLDLMHRWLTAGFYYKTFMWPNWHLFEPVIRKMAGLGEISRDVFEDYVSDQVHDCCDTLVIGGGGTGLAAAREAVETGENVILVDDQKTVGGGLFRTGLIEGQAAADWVEAQVAAIESGGGRVMRATTAFGIHDHKLVGLAEHGKFGCPPRLWRLRPGRIILASGALDRPITFANNDRPGVMSLDGACEFLARYGVLVGRNIATLSNNSGAESSARTLEQAGANVVTLDPTAGHACAIGGKRLRGVELNGAFHYADTILCSGGQTPLVHLWRHAGGKLDWNDDLQAFVPGKAPEGMIAVGSANGFFDLQHALDDARAVGADTARPNKKSSYKLTPLWPKPGSKGRQWIDFQHDVTIKDVELAARENYVSVEHLKRYTTLGMASDQGKTSNMSGLAAMAAVLDRPIPEVGTTTFRPPFVPQPLALYAGQRKATLFSPLKRLKLEPEHRAADAALVEYGGWLRPGWFGSGDPTEHIFNEVQLVRETAGIFDASPLGKIEILGPDAEAFVNFAFYNTIATLKPGHVRYGFLLNERGIVMDDGVVARLGDNRFVISCSSGHVDHVRDHLEVWRQDCNDPERIFVHDTTQHWSTVTVTGPRARDILEKIDTRIELAADAFPHMTVREGTFDGAPIRVARVSFTGELSFEVSIRNTYATALWNALLKSGASIGAGPVGSEAMMILRAEKGYIIVGKDTDGLTMPHDLGFTVPRLKKKAAFIGDRSLHMQVGNETDRRALVGLEVDTGSAMLSTGAHIVADGSKPRTLGYVTSSYDSPTLKRPIALGLLEQGAERIGEKITVWHLGKTVTATVCPPCFYDPEGVHLDA
ncbi:2Fe-2S iron-sulfur cluster-binding protein [uncultured Roseovarius sp.]|uniref:2Fe-2S iron-sulfur cluster-binding protein n=1 Tax=uncultured Roseovarius sp. TaxID=293344 RepID=UPI002629885D|nr:2Fe-2S iron-sulfur cluster-binding protein [uncultured Roseovarius sp.]